MDPRKKKRVDEKMARWLETDPTMRRLRKRIDEGRAERQSASAASGEPAQAIAASRRRVRGLDRLGPLRLAELRRRHPYAHGPRLEERAR